MKKSKRIIGLLYAGVLGTSMILTGCGKSGGNATDESTTQSVTLSTTQETESSTAELEADEEDTSEISKFAISPEYTDEELENDYDKSSAVNITLKGDTALASDSGVDITNTTITITKPGTYVISGELSDGNIVIDSSEDGNVRLVLNGASISSTSTAPIYVKNADETIITLVEGTKNTITDSADYKLEDETVSEPNGAIFSKDDLTINGLGSLLVNANYNHGIQGKDDVKIISGTIEINSVGDAIVGKDSVIVKDAEITIESQADGIKSTNAVTDKGYIYFDNPTINITSVNDGVQATTCMYIKDGEISIISGGGSVNSKSTSDSAKGLKAGVDITISGGEINIDSMDDCIHSNDTLEISGGNHTLSSGDDGIHANTEIIINSGDISIEKSYEGIESASITVNDGNIDLVASDDGFNAGGGNDSSAMNGRPGQNGFSSSSNSKLVFNGGKSYVNAGGDGLDSNGTLSITGGEVYVDGPTNSGNGAIDYDASFTMNGGILVAAGSIGMATAPTSDSTQYSVNAGLSSNYSAGTVIEVKDSQGNTILSYTPSKNFQSFVFSTSKLTSGESYTIYANGSEDCSFTVSDITTIAGNTSSGMGGGMQGGQGPMGGMGR